MASKCLICTVSITQMQIGIDACKPCAVFYRRTLRSKRVLRCKYKTGKCVQEDRVRRCRKCRFDVMKGILEQAKMEVLECVPKSIDSHKEVPLDEDSEYCESSNSRQQTYSPPSVINSPQTPLQERSIYNSLTTSIDRIRRGYNMMARMRQLAELATRPLESSVHPLAFNLDSFPFIPATPASIISTRHILHSSLFDFASIAFPEFEVLDAMEKWRIISSSAHRVNAIESIFRSTKIYPDDDRMFISYTTTTNSSSHDNILNNSPPNEISEQIVNVKNSPQEIVANCKETVRRVMPTEEEFLLMIAYSFWNIDTQDCRISTMAALHRASIMHAFHSYYSSRGENAYAKRLGELLFLLVGSEKIAPFMSTEILTSTHPHRIQL